MAKRRTCLTELVENAKKKDAKKDTSDIQTTVNNSKK